MIRSRTETFRELRQLIGHTELHEIREIPIPNGNRIFAKQEFENRLTGSHYDRVYVSLLEHLEREGEIAPDSVHLVETTSGNAGTAFAAVCEQLEYEATVIIPEGVPPGRLPAIRKHGAVIVETPYEDFVKGCVAKLRHLLTRGQKERREKGLKPYYCPNHSRQPRAVEAVAQLAEEVLTGPVDFDVFVAAAGNGISILGPARVLKNDGLHVIAWDPLQAPTAYSLRYPGRYEERFGFAPGALGHHRVFGTGVLGVDFPFLREAVLGGEDGNPMVDEVTLVVDDDALVSLSGLVEEGAAAEATLEEAKRLPYLNRAHHDLLTVENKPVGPTSAGSLAVALDYCERVENQNVLVIFYDHARNYRI